MRKRLKFPAPYFGGKSRVADLVWDRFGCVDNYVEPFAGSGAVLLARPAPGRVETLNDLDAHVANFWRAVKNDPEAVAAHADYPVSEIDLHARHRFLVGAERPEPEIPAPWSQHPTLRRCYLAGYGHSGGRHPAEVFRERMREDQDYYDARFAGWWVWGLSCWIGGGWCDAGHLTRQVPRMSDPGCGVDAAAGVGHARNAPDNRRGVTKPPPKQLPMLSGDVGSSGRGVHAPSGSNRPQLADAFSRGRVVNGNDGASTCAARRAWLADWMSSLADRLRPVRVCCGSWERVCDSESVLTRLGTTAVFLDPPYPTHGTHGRKTRDGKLYATDGSRGDLDALRDEVVAWCRKWAGVDGMKIAVCGLDSDGYEALEGGGWEVVEWKSSGYHNRSARGREAAHRERVWFSPNCKRQLGLFDNLPPAA